MAVAGALLLLVGGLVVWSSSSRRPEALPQEVGAPKLVVDQKIVDEGYVQYDVPVRTTFRLSTRNVESPLGNRYPQSLLKSQKKTRAPSLRDGESLRSSRIPYTTS